MLYREIIAVCSQIHTKHITTLCGQNVELLSVILAVHIVTTVEAKLRQLPARHSRLSCDAMLPSRVAASLLSSARFQVLKAVLLKMQAIYVVTPCRLVNS
jgi:hypothetical protein